MKIESDTCYRPCGAAERLGVSQTQIGRLIASGRLTAARTADGGYLIPVESIDRYAAERKSVKNGTKSRKRR